MQDLAAERHFYDTLFARDPENEHITAGYEEIHALALREVGEGALALDLGCGTGGHAVRLVRRGLQVVAVDLSLLGVRAARARLRREGLQASFVVADAERLPFRDRIAGLTWTSLLIHHFPKLDLLPAELARVTREHLVAFEPNAGNLLTWAAMNVVNRFWNLPMMSRNQRALRPGRLRRLFMRHGFECRSLHYLHRPWDDGLSIVRRIYIAVSRWLPERYRANKFLLVLRRRPH